MTVTVLGGTGFVGRHVVSALLKRKHEVTVVGRHRPSVAERPWISRVKFFEVNLYEEDVEVAHLAENCEVVIDLVWPGMPNYKDPFHFERNYQLSYRMLKRFIEAGVPQILVTGTCLEYGLQEGGLDPEGPTDPVTAYGLGKDMLRRSMELLAEMHDFTLQWTRLFYIYGEGQNSGSLLSLVDSAVRNGDVTFPMSKGDQLRDFLRVEDAAEQIVKKIEQKSSSGCVNICSGNPTSVRSLVEARIAELNGELKLGLGHFEYPSYEPMAFWGRPSKDLLKRV